MMSVISGHGLFDNFWPNIVDSRMITLLSKFGPE